jgi:hypothetical protein
MKTRTLILVVILIFATIVLFAGKKVTKDVIYGTWVNSEYNETGKEAKWIINPDGTYEAYLSEKDTEPIWTGHFTITDSWHDRKGNLWVKSTFDDDDDADIIVSELSKYSKDGTIWESVRSEGDYPTELSPIVGTHSILYRQ